MSTNQKITRSISIGHLLLTTHYVHPYIMKPDGIYLVQSSKLPGKNGTSVDIETRLTNFLAFIDQQVILDDGDDDSRVRREYHVIAFTESGQSGAMWSPPMPSTRSTRSSTNSSGLRPRSSRRPTTAGITSSPPSSSSRRTRTPRTRGRTQVGSRSREATSSSTLAAASQGRWWAVFPALRLTRLPRHGPALCSTLAIESLHNRPAGW